MNFFTEDDQIIGHLWYFISTRCKNHF